MTADLPPLTELQAANLPHATCESVGMEITPKDDGEESKQLAIDTIAEADEYLASFVPGGKCPRCDATLGGLLGSFTWGIANSEGHCAACKWPARAYHRHAGPFEFFEMVLPYHPNVVNQEGSP